MKPLNIGRLNKRISFIDYIESIDELGQKQRNWEDIKSVYATVKSLRGSEFVEAQKVRSEQTYKVTTRYIKGITADMRIKYKDKIFNILYVDNVDEADYMLEMTCTEIVGDVE